MLLIELKLPKSTGKFELSVRYLVQKLLYCLIYPKYCFLVATDGAVDSSFDALTLIASNVMVATLFVDPMLVEFSWLWLPVNKTNNQLQYFPCQECVLVGTKY